MTEKNLSSKNQKTADNAEKKEEFIVRPAVDIHENSKGITLLADLPGVSNQDLNIEIDGDVLSIEADVALNMPEELKLNVINMRVTKYRRNFTLSKELDTARIEAVLKNGRLELKIPKKAEVLPRKIEVQVA